MNVETSRLMLANSENWENMYSQSDQHKGLETLKCGTKISKAEIVENYQRDTYLVAEHCVKLRIL
jgi:hypothetical protein